MSSPTVHVYSFADRKIIDDVSKPEVLVPRVPRLRTFFDGIEEMRRITEESGFRGQHGGTGFSKDMSLRYLGTVPSSVMAAILEIDPWFFQNRKKVLAWLDRNPQYKVAQGAL